MNHPYYHLIALSLIPKLGVLNIKNLIAYCGSAEAVFTQSKHQLLKIPGVGPLAAASILKSNVFKQVEEELRFIEQHQLRVLSYLDAAYPKRLSHCADSPILIFIKGNTDLNPKKSIAIVGTRRATKFGKDWVEKFIEECKHYNIQIISGLALGIDAQAHKSALTSGLNTVGILAHPLNILYPPSHASLAKQMLENGSALLTEYSSQSPFLPSNFPMRNRIVAGMCDATLVVESALKGGAVITANIANSYNRDVFAVPGRPRDTYAKGCNFLIKTHKAQLMESAADLIHHLSWDVDQKPKRKIQRELALDLSEDETKLINILKDSEGLASDDLMLKCQFSGSKLAGILLELELRGIIHSLPGSRFTLA
jgi:DNA processing protein